LDSASAPGPDGPAAIRLAEAMRALGRVAVGSDAPESALERAAATIEDLVATLGQHAARSRYDQAGRLSDKGTFVNHPMIGLANPSAPPIVVEADHGDFTGHVTFGTPHEGPPDCAYGGYIAAGFDAALLMTAGINGVGGPTRSLAVRYRRPTPLHVPLRYQGRIGRMEERWVVVEGSLMAGDTVCAQATAEVAQVPLRTA
jgi:acyl-CoA thioesterase FadM